jgi:hypothetical protein
MCGTGALLGLGDVVAHACVGVEPDAQLGDVHRTRHSVDERAQARSIATAVDRHRSAVTHRDRDRLADGAEVGDHALEHDHAAGRPFQRRKRNLAPRERRDLARLVHDPGVPPARLAPATADRDVRPRGRRHPHPLAIAQPLGEPFRHRPDLDVVGRHRPVGPRLDRHRRVEAAARPGRSRAARGVGVIDRPSCDAQAHIGLDHRGHHRPRWLLAAGPARPDPDVCRVRTGCPRRCQDRLRELPSDGCVRDEQELLAGPRAKVVGDEAMCNLAEGWCTKMWERRPSACYCYHKYRTMVR